MGLLLWVKDVLFVLGLQNARRVSFGKDFYIVVEDLVVECKCRPLILPDLP
jgi:hypothetical protein